MTMLTLFFVFVVAGLLITVVSYILWLWLGRRRVIAAVRGRLSPSEMKKSFCTKFLNLLGFTALGLAVAGWTSYLSLSFGRMEYESNQESTWLLDLVTYLRPDPLRFIRAVTEEGYEIAICFGLALAVLSGFMLGGTIGKMLGMKHATKKFRITENLL